MFVNSWSFKQNLEICFLNKSRLAILDVDNLADLIGGSLEFCRLRFANCGGCFANCGGWFVNFSCLAGISELKFIIVEFKRLSAS